jgi:hypothetical protein
VLVHFKNGRLKKEEGEAVDLLCKFKAAFILIHAAKVRERRCN